MLTGDKRETAVNIARSAALIHSDMKHLAIDGDSYDEVFKQIINYISVTQKLEAANVEYALIIDGSVSFHAFLSFVLLTYILQAYGFE